MSVNTNISERPLEGVKVLDLTQAYSGPVACMHLADLGADVLKIEPIYGDQTRSWEPIVEGNSGYFSYFNRNKTGMTLNLKSEEGKEILKKLVADADVLVENYRVGTMEKLGLGYDEVLKDINPGLVYASISGFGLEGPMATRACYDTVAQAMGGMISMTGEIGSDGVKVGPAIADSYSGTYLSVGICAALFQRTQTGLGRRIDVSMVDTVFSILETGVILYTMTGEISKPVGNADPVVQPWDSYPAKDGNYIMACGTEKFWQNFCKASGMTELLDDCRFKTIPDRVAHYIPELRTIIEDWGMRHTVDEIEEIIAGAGIPFGRIQNVKQACESDLIKNRNMLWKFYDPSFKREIELPGTPIKVHGCQDAIRKPAPMLGEDTSAVLKEKLGMNEEEIKALRDKGVI